DEIRRKRREESSLDQDLHSRPDAILALRRSRGRMHRRMVRRLDRTTARFERGQREEPLRVCAVRGVAQASEDLTDGKRGWIDRVVRPRIADLSMDIEVLDRKSTRLNSSHQIISYA